MREAIVASVHSRPFTTFQDPTVDGPGLRGDLAMFTPIRDSIIIGHACSKEAIAALGSLIGDKSIKMIPASNIPYKATGDLPPVPIIRSKKEIQEDTPVIRWFPVVFVKA